MMWGTRVDVLPRGCPLTVGGVVYRHGFSAHAKSEITIPLGKAYTRFEAKFAIDDFAKQNDMHGDVVARITADGKQVWTSGGHVKGGEPARAVGPIDVTGVSELVLETDFGDGFNVNDWADWLDPLLVRAK
jgi:alpha-galactosidase